MNAVLKNFKNIPCPAGGKCTQSNCQWKHAWDQEPAASSRDGEADQLGPRKRLKVGQGDEALKDANQTKAAIATAKKPVSPPPLKRKTPTATHDGAASKDSSSSTTSKPPTHSSRPSVSRTPTSAPASPASPLKKTAPKAPRKPEALNPRHLKSSPATHEFRFRALTMLHEQFVRLNNELKRDASNEEEKLVLTDQQLIWIALDEEEKLATDKPPIYTNVIKNRITSYKRLTVAKWKEEREAQRKKELAAMMGKVANKPVLGPPKVIHTGLTPEQEVEFLSRLLTPIKDLGQFGYVPSVPTEDDVREAHKAEEAAKGWEVCDRCATRFQVFPGRREDGALTSAGKCTFHPGKPYFPEKQLGDRSRVQKRWRCCKEAVGDTPGCTKAETHVFKISHPKRLATVLPYAETPPNPLAPTNRAVCFDCEMGYTVRGLELIRLTATSWPDGQELLDVLVQPLGEILDLNSRYSGVWPEDIINAEPFFLAKGDDDQPPLPGQTSVEDREEGELEDAGPPKTKKKKKMQIVSSPAVARDLLFSLISPATPLIGHGLENDLNAVRAVHPTLVDTVLLYPHKRGLPIRHGLKALMEALLNRAIQVEQTTDDGKPVGHDSAEDARAAGELVRLKVQQEWARLKGLGWTLVDGEFVPPAGEGDGKGGGSLTEAFLEKQQPPTADAPGAGS